MKLEWLSLSDIRTLPSADPFVMATLRPPRSASSRIVRMLLIGMAAGGALLSFRWPTPIGNLTIDRALGLLALGFLILGSRHPLRMPRVVLPVVIASAAFLCVVCAGLLYSPVFGTGVAQTGNVASGLFLFFVAVLLAHKVLRRSSDRRTVELVAMTPLWGFLPSGLLGVFQAGQLLSGVTPSIPFQSLSRLDESTLNSARTAFGSGLNEFQLDRIAAATGDPPTFGTLCALTFAYVLWLRRTSLLRSKGLFRVVVCVASVGVVLSASITAMLVAAVALIFNRPRNLRGWRHFLLGLSALGALLLALLVVVPAANGFLIAAQRRVGSTTSGSSFAEHINLASTALNVFASHPLFGVGTGGLTFHQHGFDVGFSSVHSTLLLALAEGGIVAGTILVCLWFLIARTYVPLGVFVPCLVAWLIYLDFARLPFMWVFLGVAVAVSYWLRGARRNARPFGNAHAAVAAEAPPSLIPG